MPKAIDEVKIEIRLKRGRRQWSATAHIEVGALGLDEKKNYTASDSALDRGTALTRISTKIEEELHMLEEVGESSAE